MLSLSPVWWLPFKNNAEGLELSQFKSMLFYTIYDIVKYVYLIYSEWYVSRMNMGTVLAYLSELETHNEREWDHANKKRYQEANAVFEALLQQLILQIDKTDPGILHNNPKDLTFILVRDTRFSYDKSPYNPSLRAHISSAGKLPVPVGYYIKIQPANRSFLGGGLFADMFKDATEMVRNYIVKHSDNGSRLLRINRFRSCSQLKAHA